jgi:hypothetical protein
LADFFKLKLPVPPGNVRMMIVLLLFLQKQSLVIKTKTT